MIESDGILGSTLFEGLPVIHGFTTRLKGNLGYGKNPGDPEVSENRRKLFHSLKLENRRHVQPRQIHSGICIESRDFIPGMEADAVISRSTEDLLSVLTADCVPILLYHPEGIVAAIHAGWRGLSAGVIPAALQSLPPHPLAVIGPSIGVCCYEVSEELAGDFKTKFGPAVVQAGQKPHLDLTLVSMIELQKNGVTEMDACRFCTRCHADLFYSYRREGSSGRMMSFIGLA